MVNIKFFINDKYCYEYLDNDFDSDNFFPKHKKLKKNTLYVLTVYIKKNNLYYKTSISGLYLYIINDQPILLTANKKEYYGTSIIIKDHRSYKITLYHSYAFLYHFYITDKAGFEKEFFYVKEHPLDRRKTLISFIKNKRYHIEYYKQSYDKKSLYNAMAIITIKPQNWFSRLKNYLKLKFKN